jgi:cysteine desulfurase
MAVYLDHNASTPLHEDVLQAMLPVMQTMTGNPSSLHRFGRLQKDTIEKARQQVADLVSANPDQVVFTSGGTEANNLLVKGMAASADINRMAISSVEHMAMLEPAAQIADKCAVDYIGVDRDGRVTPNTLEQAILPDTRLVSVMSANNETGVIQDIASLAEIAGRKNIWFHTDASQAAGKIDVSFKDWGVHAMTLSAHKLYGPTGAGALLVDKRLPLQALMHGGGQEHRLRAGTENVAAIAGFGAAAELAKKELNKRAVHALHLREALEKGLAQIPQATVFAQDAQRLPNTVQFGIRGFDGETLLMQLDRKGLAVSSGSACTSGKTEPSHVLKAMGVPEELALSSVRVSFGKDNTIADAEKLLQALGEIIDTTSKSAVMMAATV